ncbi:MAG: hypothetical protein AAGD38_17800 [Acidobacteriota bacterium]
MKRLSIALLVTLAASTLGCTTSPTKDVITELRRELDRYPAYSVILEDMRREGSFVKRQEHLYRVVIAEPDSNGELAFRDELLEWYPVSERVWERYRPCLGMTVAAKANVEEGETPTATEECRPAGYGYVGDRRYGEWRTDSSGNSFWAFYGKYALLSHMLGGLRGPVYRNEWDAYRTARRSNRPFFGTKSQWGTTGSMTRTTNPTFYQRQQARSQASRSRFSDRVDQRAGRSRSSSSRSRSGGSRGGK